MVCQSEQKASEADGIQAVGWPNSTDEDAKSARYKHWREVENVGNPLLTAMRNKLERETSATHRGRRVMETKLERITQLSKENPDVVFTSIGHLINKEMLRE